MSEEFGLTNSGDNVVPVPVEVKEPTIPAAELTKIAPPVEKKKRGRPAKRSLKPIEGAVEVAPVEEVEEKLDKEWYCSTCRERYTDSSVMKMGAGTNRYAVFCPSCTKFLNYVDEVVQNTVKDWVDNNPTGK